MDISRKTSVRSHKRVIKLEICGTEDRPHNSDKKKPCIL